MPFLDVLEGLSPWWWVTAAFAIGALEMLTGTAVLIWVSLSALAMAGLLVAVPALSGELQVSIFAALSVAITFVGRWVVNRFGDGAEPHETLNQRSKHLIGRTAKVLDFDAGASTGAIEVEGMRWRANWSTNTSSEIGSTVRIKGADGMTLTVEPVQ